VDFIKKWSTLDVSLKNDRSKISRKEAKILKEVLATGGH
jgi:hypothetical protein